jgi:hypothetical protein
VETNSRKLQKTAGEKPQSALKKCPVGNARGHSTLQQSTAFLVAKINSGTLHGAE